jgi:hypothetical protein
MTHAEISAARALADAATEGPWVVADDSPRGFGVGQEEWEHRPVDLHPWEMFNKTDAAFIAASRTLVPKLCDALEAAQRDAEVIGNVLEREIAIAREHAEERDEARAECERLKAKDMHTTKFYDDTNAALRAAGVGENSPWPHMNVRRLAEQRDDYKARLARACELLRGAAEDPQTRLFEYREKFRAFLAGEVSK